MEKLVLARLFEISSTTGQPQKYCGRCAQGRKMDNRGLEPSGAPIRPKHKERA